MLAVSQGGIAVTGATGMAGATLRRLSVGDGGSGIEEIRESQGGYADEDGALAYGPRRIWLGPLRETRRRSQSLLAARARERAGGGRKLSGGPRTAKEKGEREPDGKWGPRCKEG